jgi:putative effector of murein hydrolase
MSPRLIAGACLLATALIYIAARKLHRRYPYPCLMPVLVVPAVLIAGLLLSGTPFCDYFRYTRWLLWLLGPATVAFALPIYEQRHLFRRYPLSITLGTLSGVTLGLASSWALARLFALSPDLSRSLLLRSISTPFALQAAVQIRTSPDLASLVVLLTGCCGILLGELVLLWTRTRSSFARGAMWGAAAHALGTARAQQRDPDEGVIASLVMVLSGLLMMALAAWIG